MPYQMPSMLPDLVASFGNAYLAARRQREQDVENALALAFQKTELAKRQAEEMRSDYLQTMNSLPLEQRQEFARRIPLTADWKTRYAEMVAGGNFVARPADYINPVAESEIGKMSTAGRRRWFASPLAQAATRPVADYLRAEAEYFSPRTVPGAAGYAAMGFPTPETWQHEPFETESEALARIRTRPIDAWNNVLAGYRTGGRAGARATAEHYQDEFPGIVEQASALPKSVAELGVSLREVQHLDAQRQRAWTNAFRLKTAQANAEYRNAEMQLRAAMQGYDLPSLGIPDYPDPGDYVGDANSLFDALYERVGGKPPEKIVLPGVGKQPAVSIPVKPSGTALPPGFMPGGWNPFAPLATSVKSAKAKQERRAEPGATARERAEPGATAGERQAARLGLGPMAQELELSASEKAKAGGLGFSGPSMIYRPNKVRELMGRADLFTGRRDRRHWNDKGYLFRERVSGRIPRDLEPRLKEALRAHRQKKTRGRVIAPQVRAVLREAGVPGDAIDALTRYYMAIWFWGSK